MAATDQKATVDARGGLLRPLRRRDVRLLMVGQSLSTFGDMLFLVALPFLLVKDGLASGAGQLALTLTVLGAARLAATPLGGLLADRWHPRRVMLIADAGRAVAMALFLPLLADRPLLWQLIAGGLLVGTLEGVFLPAYRAIMPALVPDDELAAANSVGESASVLAVIVGPLVAGALVVAIGAAPVIALNAVSFAVSAALLAAMRPAPSRGAADAERASGETGLIRFIRTTPLFAAVLAMTGLLGLTAAAVISVALPLLAAGTYPDGARVFGYLMGANGAGLLLGTLLAGAVRWPPRRGLLAVGLLAGHGLLMLAVPHLSLLGQLAAIAGLGLVDGLLGVLVLTVVQQLAPPRLRGRAMAAFTLVRTSVFPAAAALAGLVVALWGAGRMFVVAGLGVVLVAVLGTGLRSVREAR